MNKLDNNAIKFSNVEKWFKNFKSLDNTTFEVKKGSFHAIIGPNGAGKTTLIRCLLGFYLDYKGQISINNINSKDFKSKQKIGYIPEIADFPKILTTYEYLYYFALISGLTKNEAKIKVNSLLKEYKMDGPEFANKSPFNMSSGQKRQVLLMQALLNDPEILILDEPVANLDPQNRAEFYDAIKKFHQKGNTIFISSHILSELEKYIDSYTIIDKGKIIETNTIANYNKDLTFNWLIELSNGKDKKTIENLFTQNKIIFKQKDELTYLMQIPSAKAKNILLNLIIQQNIEFTKFEEYKELLAEIYFSKTKQK